MHQKKQEDHTSKKLKSNLKFMLYTYNIDVKHRTNVASFIYFIFTNCE